MESDQGFRMTMIALMVSLIVTPCLCETNYAYFSDAANCGNTFSVGRDDILKIAGERNPTGGTSAFSDCALLVKTTSLNDKLCVKIIKIEFTNPNLKLVYFDTLDAGNITPDKTFESNTGPTEFCSSQRDITLKLERKNAQANIRDVSIDMEVVNMQGSKRIGHMDEDCGITYDLSDSVVHVLSRNSQGSGTKHDVCQLYFKYVGTNPNKTVCLEYTETGSTNCDFELKVIEGSVEQGYQQKQTYSCTNSLPQQWCADKAAMHLELQNKGTGPLPESVFSVRVKDGIKECADGYYGADCSSVCGHCINGHACDKNNGYCDQNCDGHFQPPFCKSCIAGKYGLNCSKSCGQCRNNSKCHKTTGLCPNGCSRGYIQPFCVKDCADYTYGDNCSGVCSCLNQCEVCDKVNGSCHTGYQPTTSTTSTNSISSTAASTYTAQTIGLSVMGSLLAATCTSLAVMVLKYIKIKSRLTKYEAEKHRQYSTLTPKNTRIYDVITDSHQYANDSINVQENQL